MIDGRFTFQYVPINTEKFKDNIDFVSNLHSNMFLLIRFFTNVVVNCIDIYIPICSY